SRRRLRADFVPVGYAEKAREARKRRAGSHGLDSPFACSWIRICMAAADKVKEFPPRPGVYLMKDEQGRVLYVGKAKNLRNRAGHYFTKAATLDERTCDLVKLIADIDFIEAESEVDALLLEARLVK